jgi:hypothetical protein
MRRIAFLASLAAPPLRASSVEPPAACPRVRLAWLPPTTQFNVSSYAAANVSNDFGLEDGIVVRRADGGFSMVAAEMYASPKWVSMRIGVFTSRDGLDWTRARGLRTSTGDFTGASLHSSSWGPFLLYDPTNSTWALSYVGYRGAPSNASGWLENFEGTIFARSAAAPGDAGLDSDFSDATAFAPGGDAVLLAPDDFRVNGPWPHVCQGLQGTDSMFPYRLDDGTWAALVGTSHQETPNAYGPGKWPVSLATAPALFGPWTRRNAAAPAAPADAPCVDLNGGYSENPIVARRPDDAGAFHAVFDYLGSEGAGFGYACSADGLAWARAALVAVPGGCRTPFGLLPMTAAEAAARRADVLAYGIVNATSIDAPNTALQWLFYTVDDAHGYENFRAAIVQLEW